MRPPGGAGKSTVAPLIAERLGIAGVDIDRRFADRVGDISEYITRFGYDAYARENVETYWLQRSRIAAPFVGDPAKGRVS